MLNLQRLDSIPTRGKLINAYRQYIYDQTEKTYEKKIFVVGLLAILIDTTISNYCVRSSQCPQLATAAS
ncbi:hypothetical protein B9Z47_11635 [Limnohabitans sp. 2KL-1]|nr:hypothetical protein B9Z47_11635 [Limnohabitans sp. 2KL-1]